MTGLKEKRANKADLRAAARFPYWKLPFLLLLPLGALWARVCSPHPELIERLYSGGVYPGIKNGLSAVASLVSFSIAEWILYALILWAIVTVFGSLLAWALRRIGGRRVFSALLSLGMVVGAVWNLFYFTWGFNYFRVPLKERMGLTVCARPVEALETLTYALARQAAQLRETLPEDASGLFTLDGELQAVLDALPEAYAALALQQPVFAGRTTRAKRVLWSEGLSWMGIRGVYVGITGEPNINVRQSALLIPQSAAHEMAHQLGIASENEAEFSAYLACQHSPDARVRYSGVVNALIQCRNALRKIDPDAASAVRDTYSDGMVRDFTAYDAYWDAFDGPIEEAVTNVNDAYLKHNAQESGVKSYGESVDLLLAYYNQTKN